MTRSEKTESDTLLLLVAGAKGAVASTVAAAIAVMQHDPAGVVPSLTTGNLFSFLGPLSATRLAGWDSAGETLTAAIEKHGVIPGSLWKSHAGDLDRLSVLPAPSPAATGRGRSRRSW